MKDKKQEMIDYARSLGINLTIDPTLRERHGGKVFFPEKLAKANEIVAKLKPLPQ